MPYLEGVDVSHSHGAIDWQQVKDAGIAFALIKATEGEGFVDPDAQANLTGCRAAGIVPGMYHFYRHDQTPEDQVTNFLRNLAHQPGDLVPAIDVETPQDGAGPFGYPTGEVVARLEAMVNAIRAAIGRAPMIYTYPSAWKEVTGNSPVFAGACPLWIASYNDQPTLVGGWTDYAVWQYSVQGSVEGIGTRVDRDRINGGLNELKAFCLGS